MSRSGRCFLQTVKQKIIMEKKITILGEEITIAFNMAVEMAYERITGSPFKLEDLKFKMNVMPLYMAAIIANNPDTKITFDDLSTKATKKEIMALDEAVSETMSDWLEIPSVIPEEKKPEGDDEEQPKN